MNSSRLYDLVTAGSAELGCTLAIGPPERAVGVWLYSERVAGRAAVLDATQSGTDDECAVPERGVSGSVEHPGHQIEHVGSRWARIMV